MRGPARDGKSTEYTVIAFNVPYCIYGVDTINDAFRVYANATHESGGQEVKVNQGSVARGQKFQKFHGLCRFSTADVRLLTWADHTPLPHNHPGNRKYLSNDVLSDWKHPSEKSMDRKWMTSVDRKWVTADNSSHGRWFPV